MLYLKYTTVLLSRRKTPTSANSPASTLCCGAPHLRESSLRNENGQILECLSTPEVCPFENCYFSRSGLGRGSY